MTPEVANDALNATLATLQSLIQRCIHLKQSDPEALKLSDEIARRVVSVFSVSFHCIVHFGTGKRLKGLWGECYIILPSALVLRSRCATILKGWRLSNIA
jgi:hypothetical protein